MAPLNVSIPDPVRDWVEQRVETGLYDSVSDYVENLIRRDQAQEGEHKAVIAALIEGERSGVSEHSIPDILAAVVAERLQNAG